MNKAIIIHYISMKESGSNFASDLFGADSQSNQKADKSNEDDKEEKKRQFLNILSEDDVKRRHNESQDEMRKAKR